MSAPEVTLRRAPMGRESLAAITNEAAGGAAVAVRPMMDTLSYEDRPLHPAAPPGRGTAGSDPEMITVEERPAGRDTLAAIEAELGSEAGRRAPRREPGAPGPASGAADRTQVYEVALFYLRGQDAAALAGAPEAARRRFVERRLAHRLPVASMDEVVRVDVTRVKEDRTAVVRVWCRVPPRPGRW